MPIINMVYLNAGGGGWKPGANTILYMPFKSDTLDHSSNNIQFTNTNVIISNETAYFNGSASLRNSNFTTYLNQKNFTVSVWVNSSVAGWDKGIVTSFSGSSQTYNGWDLTEANNGGWVYRAEILPGGQIYSGVMSVGTRYLLTLVISSTSATFYVNGISVGTNNWSIGTLQDKLYIGENTNYSNYYFEGYMSNLIIESKQRTADEIAAYYNQTKSKYGL